jgi:uncharacterized protein
MRWTPGGRSSDIEDRRGQDDGGGPGLGGGGLGGLPGGGGGIRLPVGRMGLGGLVVLLILGWLASRGTFTGGGGGGPQQAPAPSSGVSSRTAPAADDDKMVQFVSFVLDDLQSTWEKKLGSRYRHAKLVLFSNSTRTSCGRGMAAMGPFYCPPDEKVYLDLAFFQELSSRFGAPGDFAQAYVIAHEMGHHVQNLLGIEAQVGRNKEDSIRLELQADCFAGVWGASTEQRKLLDPGDIEEGLRAAAAVGDDTLQKQAGERVAPETWTHGSAEMRARWLRRGLESGDIAACDTFHAREL